MITVVNVGNIAQKVSALSINGLFLWVRLRVIFGLHGLQGNKPLPKLITLEINITYILIKLSQHNNKYGFEYTLSELY